MRKKNLPANLSLELSVSDLRGWFVSEMNNILDDMHPDAMPSDDDIKKYFDKEYPDYREQLRDLAVSLVMENLDEVFDDMVSEYHGEIEKKNQELRQKEEAAMSDDAKKIMDKARKSLTQAEIDALVRHINRSPI